MAAKIDFPVEISNPDYPLGINPEDNVIRSETENGPVKTRPKFTKVRSSFTVTWKNLPEAEKQILEQFINVTSKGGAVPFNWINPADGKSYVVVLAEPPQYSLQFLHYYNVNLNLQEV